MPAPKNVRKSSSVSSREFSKWDGQYSRYLSQGSVLPLSLSLYAGDYSLPLKLLLWFLYGLTTIFAVTSFLLLAPVLETKYWPVVGKMVIEKMEYDGPNSTRVWASFEKLRSCDWLGIAWFHGTRDTRFERVMLQLYRDPKDISSPNRPLGYQNTGPWIVSIPMRDIEKNSFVELYHQCTPFWVTRTEFFP